MTVTYMRFVYGLIINGLNLDRIFEYHRLLLFKIFQSAYSDILTNETS